MSRSHPHGDACLSSSVASMPVCRGSGSCIRAGFRGADGRLSVALIENGGWIREQIRKFGKGDQPVAISLAGRSAPSGGCAPVTPVLNTHMWVALYRRAGQGSAIQ